MKDFLTTTQTHPPQIPLPYYLLMLLAMVLLSYLSWRWYKNKIWYLWQGFPLYISLPLYHCRMAMFAVLLLKNSKIKSYFAIMGVVGTYCALIYPVFDPYEFPHITGFSFLIGHYALLVNSLNVIFNSYKTHPISKRLIVVATLLLNLALVIVNQTIGGNYGMLKHTPFIMGTPLFVKYLAVSGALIILMIIMKKGLEHFEDKY